MSIGMEDRWLHPRRQTEYPARDFVSEVKLHARREATFLVLSTLFTVSLTMLLVLGITRLINLGDALGSVFPDIELPAALQLPFGALPAAIGFLAVLLTCELYGRRRAAALLWVGGFAALALVGVARLADVIDGRDAALLPTAALAVGALAAHLIGLLVFASLRRQLGGRHAVARALLASAIAQPAGWAAFGGVLYLAQVRPDVDGLIAIGFGGSVFTLVCMLVLALPLAIAKRGLSLYLRVARWEDASEVHVLPPALIVEEESDESDGVPQPQPEPRRQRAQRVSMPAFSPAELRFFTEGDQLEPAP
jgi:uncharacterized PurR-regulated membrane protein YhhQ (DUF165 family)